MISLAQTLLDLGVEVGKPIDDYGLKRLREKFAAIDADERRRLRSGLTADRSFHAVEVARTDDGKLLVRAAEGPLTLPVPKAVSEV